MRPHVSWAKCGICPKIIGSLPNGFPMVPLVFTGTHIQYLFQSKNWLIIAELVFIYWLYSKSWASQLSFMKNWEVSVFLMVWTSTKNILYDDYHDFCIENWSLYSSSAIKIAFLSLCLSKYQKLRASFFMVLWTDNLVLVRVLAKSNWNMAIYIGQKYQN